RASSLPPRRRRCGYARDCAKASQARVMSFETFAGRGGQVAGSGRWQVHSTASMPVLATFWHPVPATHASTVHGSPSSQEAGSPGWQPPGTVLVVVEATAPVVEVDATGSDELVDEDDVEVDVEELAVVELVEVVGAWLVVDVLDDVVDVVAVELEV